MNQSANNLERPSTPNGSPRRTAQLICALLLVFGSLPLLFVNLGHHPLWGDEAVTALLGEGVWQTGDTSAVLGHNVLFFANGRHLTPRLVNRHEPPLQFYLAALCGLFPGNASVARLPFALCSWLALVIIAYWLWRDASDPWTAVLVSLGLLTSLAFFAYARQCR